MIECRDLRRSFGNVEAVKGVTFTVKEGEYFGLLGPNGAGKSTTIRILTTLLRPTSGDATVGGHDVVVESTRVREIIGLVSDKMIMYGHLTARENLRFFGRLHRVPPEILEPRINEVLDLLRMDKWADARFAGFSTGMKQRMNIARALITNPKVLFLDEPTLGLDPQSTREVRDFTRRLNKELGTTIVLTTHQMSEADLLCDRIAIVDHGKIVACDTPAALKRQVSGGAGLVVEVGLAQGAKAVADAALAKGLAQSAEVSDGRVRILANGTLEDVLDVVRTHGRGITAITTHEPTLEDVFLHLTGREMRDSDKKPTKKLPLWMRVLVKYKRAQALRKVRRAKATKATKPEETTEPAEIVIAPGGGGNP